MSKNIPADATIADVINTLSKPEEYLRRVLGNMLLCKRQHGSALVRIGTTGSGLSPHYRVEPSKETYPDLLENMDADVSAWFTAYNGRGHEQIKEWGAVELSFDNWSDRSMTFDEVQALLGKLRGTKRKGSS